MKMKHLLLTTIAAVLLVGCGEPSIHDAAWDGNIDAVKKHLDAGVDVNEDDYLGTPLQVAARRGHNAAVKLLIAEGADVNAKGGYEGWTPLRWAAGMGRKEIVELLIAEGADVNAKGADGWTPLDWAEETNNKETADLLRKHGGKTGEELKAESK
jgi:ankyrin repeat protein